MESTEQSRKTNEKDFSEFQEKSKTEFGPWMGHFLIGTTTPFILMFLQLSLKHKKKKTHWILDYLTIDLVSFLFVSIYCLNDGESRCCSLVFSANAINK